MSTVYTPKGMVLDSASLRDHCTQYNIGVMQPKLIQQAFIQANAMHGGYIGDAALNEWVARWDATSCLINQPIRDKLVLDTWIGILTLRGAAQPEIDAWTENWHDNVAGGKWDPYNQTAVMCQSWFDILQQLVIHQGSGQATAGTIVTALDPATDNIGFLNGVMGDWTPSGGNPPAYTVLGFLSGTDGRVVVLIEGDVDASTLMAVHPSPQGGEPAMGLIAMQKASYDSLAGQTVFLSANPAPRFIDGGTYISFMLGA